MADREIKVGQWWFDRDTRVTSQWVRVMAVRNDGRVELRRGRGYSTGQKSTVRADRLRKRFLLAFDVEEAA